MTGGGEWEPDGAQRNKTSRGTARRAPTQSNDDSRTRQLRTKRLDSQLRGFQRADLGRDYAAREAPEPQLPEPAFGFLPAIAPSGRGELVHHHREDGGLGRPGQAVVQEELQDEDLSAGAEHVPHPLEQGPI